MAIEMAIDRVDGLFVVECVSWRVAGAGVAAGMR
jgi:hypothetical protein